MTTTTNGSERERLYNLVLELVEGLKKMTPVIDRQSREAAAQAKALYDLLPAVETKHDYLINQQRTNLAEVRDVLEKFIARAEADRREIIDHFVAIRTATALAANDAGDAKRAADRAAEATGQHKLVKASDTEPAGGEADVVIQGDRVTVRLKKIKKLAPWLTALATAVGWAIHYFTGGIK